MAMSLPGPVGELTWAMLARVPDVPPPRVDVPLARIQTPIPAQQSLRASMVRRSPRLWSILFDGLSASDQRWVLETIARYAAPDGRGAP